MSTRTAFFLRFLLPPLYASLAISVFVLLVEDISLRDAASLLGMAALFAYVIAGLPALLFAAAMKHIEKRSDFRACLAKATLLGGLAGTIIGGFTMNPVAAAVLVSLGLVVGGLVESTVILFKRRACHVQ